MCRSANGWRITVMQASSPVRSRDSFFHEMGAKKVAFLGGDYDWGYSNSLGLKDYWEKKRQTV